MSRQAWPGGAWRGRAWLGKARQAKAATSGPHHIRWNHNDEE